MGKVDNASPCPTETGRPVRYTDRMNRRQFLGTGLGAPLILGAASKSDSRLPTVGSGAFRYEVIHDWGELPSNIQYGNTHGVCEDSHGRIYVHHTVHSTSESADTIVVFDRKGKFVGSWGKQFKGGAHGLHIRKEGRDEFLYLCDTAKGLVTKTTLKGEEVFTIGYPTESPAYAAKPKWSPTNLAVAPNGEIYVGDGYGSSFINVYSPQGKFLRTFAGKGKEAGKVDCPHGIALDARGPEPLLVVADRANKRLQYFNLAGEHVKFVEGVKAPCHFHERKGILLIPDLSSRVTLLDKSNKVIEHLGDLDAPYGDLRKKPRDQFPAGKFICPHGACFDSDGNIFVVEWVEVGRVTKLRHVS